MISTRPNFSTFLRNSFVSVNRITAESPEKISHTHAQPLQRWAPKSDRPGSHVRGHYRRNYHVASMPGAFQLRGTGETRRAPSFSSREKPCAAVCVTYRRGYLHQAKGERSEREPAYRFICILVCRCKSFNYVHHKSRHGPSVCSCARARVCSRPSYAPLPLSLFLCFFSFSLSLSLSRLSTPVHTLGDLFCDEKRDTLGGR